MPIPALAAATRRSAAATSGRRCSSVAGNTAGIGGSVGSAATGGSVNSSGVWPASTATACSSVARWTM